MADVRTSTKHHHLPFSPSFLPPTSTTSTLQTIPIANQTCTCNQPDILNHTACPVHESKAEEAFAHLNTTEKQGETSLDQETVRPIRPQIRTQNQRSKQPRTIKPPRQSTNPPWPTIAPTTRSNPPSTRPPSRPLAATARTPLRHTSNTVPTGRNSSRVSLAPHPIPRNSPPLPHGLTSLFSPFSNYHRTPATTLPSKPHHPSARLPVSPPHPPIPTTKPRASTRRRIMNITP